MKPTKPSTKQLKTCSVCEEQVDSRSLNRHKRAHLNNLEVENKTDVAYNQESSNTSEQNSQPNTRLTRSNLAGSTSVDTSPERKTLTGESIRSANQFNMNTVTQNVELRLEVKILGRQVQEYIEKMEMKNAELLELKVKLGQVEIRLEDQNVLIVILQANKVELKESLELKEQKIHQLEQQIKAKNDQVEQVRTEAYNQGLEVMKQVYNLVKDKEEREAIKNLITTGFSRLGSIVPSPEQSLECSQDGSVSPQAQFDNEDQYMQINTKVEEENKDSDIVTVCHLCGSMVSGLALKWNGIEVMGALMTHLNNDCSYVNNYTVRVNEVASKWEKYLEGEKLKPYKDIRSFFSACNEFFTLIHPKVKHLPRIKENKDGEDMIDKQDNDLDLLGKDLISLKKDLLVNVGQFQNMLSSITITKTFYSCQKADKLPQESGYYLVDRELEMTATGRCSILKRAEEIQSQPSWQNKEGICQQQLLSDLTRYWCSPCQRIFSCLDLWIQHCTPSCNYSDVFFNLKYDHSFGSGLFCLPDAVVSSNGLTKRKMSMAEITIVKNEIQLLNSQLKMHEITQRKLEAEQKRTPLEQKRVDQEIIIKQLFKRHQSDLLIVEDWLNQLSLHFKRIDPYTKIGLPICDAIILKKCPLLFGDENHNINMKSYFQSHGIPVAIITDARKKGFVFLGLDDAKNQFSNDLIQKLKAMIADMVFKVKEKNGNWREIFIYQIDYAQDILGFFMSTNVMADLKEFSACLGMPYSRTLDQLATCFQFASLVSQDDKQVPSQRVKLYNKWVHLLTSGQKKWMSMNLNKIFDASISFYIDKLQPTQRHGLSRIELSDYFYSQEDQSKFFKSTTHYEKEIDKALKVLNSLPQLNYSLSLNDCLDSYMKMVDNNRTLVAFENNLIGIAYSYCKRSCRFAGHLVNVTSKSKFKLLSDFMRSYGRENLRVFINGKQFLVKKTSPQMLIPITSLNEKHNLQHLANLQINETFCDSRRQDEINAVGLFCDDPEFYTIFGKNLDLNQTNNKKQLFEFDYCQDDDAFRNKDSRRQEYVQSLQRQQCEERNRNKRSYIDLDTALQKTESGLDSQPSQNKRYLKLVNKEESKNTIRDKKNYAGGGINITQGVEIRHTKKGNVLYVQSMDECKFKAEAGGSKFYSKYNCESHCKMFIEKYDGVYYLFKK